MLIEHVICQVVVWVHSIRLLPFKIACISKCSAKADLFLLLMIFIGFPSLAYMSNVIFGISHNKMFLIECLFSIILKTFGRLEQSHYICINIIKNTFKNVSIKVIKLHNECIYVIRFNIILGVIYVFPLLHKNIKFSFFERNSNIFIYFS